MPRKADLRTSGEGAEAGNGPGVQLSPSSPDRQSGEGQAVGLTLSPKVSPNLTDSGEVSLPADLIDRAVRAAAEWACWYNGWSGFDALDAESQANHLDLARGPAEAAVEAVAPLLVAHGREQALRDVARNRRVAGEELTNGANQLIEMGERAEREKWEARIEKLAEIEDRSAHFYRVVNQNYTEAAVHKGRARLLRSLLNDSEGADQ